MKPRSIRAENLLGLGILSLHLKSVASMKLSYVRKSIITGYEFLVTFDLLPVLFD